MKIAIMQPYFFPYIGYFQLMNAADEFVVYDNIEYSKGGWVNRNRILLNKKDSYITLPLKKGSDYLFIKDRFLALSWAEDREKMIKRLHVAYQKAPFFKDVFPLLKECLLHSEYNLFKFLIHSLIKIREYLDINNSLIISSEIPINHELKAEKKVLEICRERNAQVYINPIGGKYLYSKQDFASNGVELFFLRTSEIAYKQFNNAFIPNLSVVDVMMFNSKTNIKEYLNHFTLL